MNKSNTNIRLLLFFLSVISIGGSLDAKAKPNIQDILSTGDIWILAVDGERDNLVIRGSNSQKLKGGSFKFNYQLAWAGFSGVLIAVSDGENSSQFVTLQLTRSNGIKIICRGYIAQKAATFMAGTCGSKKSPSAWYATSSGSKLAVSQSAKNNTGTYEKGLQSCMHSVDKLTRSNRELNNKYLIVNNVKLRCQSSLKKCYQENLETSCKALSKKSFSSFKNKVDGYYYIAGAGGDKADSQVQKINISGRPGSGSDLGNFLRQHNGALLGLANGVLDRNDRDRFSGQERQKCNDNIYCEMALRQQVISCALDLGC